LELLKDEKKVKLRRKQLLNHYFVHLTKDPDKMSDIGGQAGSVVEAALKSQNPEGKPILEHVLEQVGDEGKTIKTLFRLHDGHLIESVLMFYRERTTLCISSQVGCAMKCPFCATGKLGLTRNLTASEIVEQVWFSAKKALEKTEEGMAPLSNVVFMGMGEPTQNLDAIFEALEWTCEPDADTKLNHPTFGIPARNVTVSTVGSVPGIRELADFSRPIRLAISLHAPDDTLRSELVPMNKTFNVAAVLNAGFEYFEQKKRRISIEYALMRDMNDSAENARLLAKVLNQRGSGWAHVNLIPLNEVEGSKWTASTPESTERFIHILEDKGVPVTLRDSRGSDIDGACGQLAGKSA
jgi:23S rRNA (adenine2503-C2)-methyltransferase